MLVKSDPFAVKAKKTIRILPYNENKNLYYIKCIAVFIKL